MREPLKDQCRLLHIIEAIDNIYEFTDGITLREYQANKVLRFAVIKNLEIVGEAAYKVSVELKTQHPEVEWSVVIRMRHVLVHGYYQIKDEIVWAVIEEELQPLKEKIQAIVHTFN